MSLLPFNGKLIILSFSASSPPVPSTIMYDVSAIFITDEEGGYEATDIDINNNSYKVYDNSQENIWLVSDAVVNSAPTSPFGVGIDLVLENISSVQSVPEPNLGDAIISVLAGTSLLPIPFPNSRQIDQNLIYFVNNMSYNDLINAEGGSSIVSRSINLKWTYTNILNGTTVVNSTENGTIRLIDNTIVVLSGVSDIFQSGDTSQSLDRIKKIEIEFTSSIQDELDFLPDGTTSDISIAGLDVTYMTYSPSPPDQVVQYLSASNYLLSPRISGAFKITIEAYPLGFHFRRADGPINPASSSTTFNYYSIANFFKNGITSGIPFQLIWHIY